MDAQTKKAMFDSYKNKEIEGGIYCIECTGNGKKWIKRTKDLASIQNRFEFSLNINSCPEPSMRASWDNFGAETFKFSVLEKISKKKDQTDAEYTDDLEALLKMFKEKEALDK